MPCCTSILEANLNSNEIGIAHIGWISIEKFIQLLGNSTCGAISIDWQPCV
ncbi:MAG: hypothetical protein PHS80_00650 [Methanothrix sp.]|nr:hypothetical protein [Methanothrix sp.]MDD4448300.1 hypothetical protein [Methanothrix sp.]